MTGYGKSPDCGEPKGTWKTDLLAVLLILTFALVAVAYLSELTASPSSPWQKLTAQS
jgi:hypothetical protein